MVNRSILCNCGIEAENNFLLEFLAACHYANTNLVMNFMVNIAFTNSIGKFNITKELKFPILTNKTTTEFTLRLFLKLDLETSYKNYFTNNFIVDIFVFIIAIISVITTMLIVYILCKHTKLRKLVTSLALQHVIATKKEGKDNMCECTFQFYIILALSIAIIGLVLFMILQIRRIKLCRGKLFSNIVKIMLFMSDVQYYILVKLCRTAVSIYFFKITGKLTPDKVKLNKHYICDILEVDWKEIMVTFNGKVINIPKFITVKLWDKFKGT